MENFWEASWQAVKAVSTVFDATAWVSIVVTTLLFLFVALLLERRSVAQWWRQRFKP